MRTKLKLEDKKDKITLTIDKKLMELFENYLISIDINNKSKFIEFLIKNDKEK